MISNLRKLVLLTFFTSFHVTETHGGASILIQPEQVSEIVSEDVHISCRPEGIDNKAREILLMQIFKEQEKPLAEIHQNFQKSGEVKVTHSKYEISGYIDKDITLSALNMTLLKAGNGWSGNYTCKIYYMDDSGMLNEDSSVGKLTVTAANSAILKTIVEPLMKKISSVETIATQHRDETLLLKKKMTSLEIEAAFLQKKATSLEKEKTSMEKTVTSLQNKILNLEKKANSLEGEASSTGQKVAELEKTNKKVETDRTADQASISERLKTLEQKQSDQIKSLSRKESSMESSVKQVNQKLSQEVKNRLADKAALSSVMKKINTLEQTSGDQTKQIQTLQNKDNDQLIKIQSLVTKEAALESKQGKQYSEMTSKIDQLPNRVSFSSIGNRMALLENNSKKEKAARLLDSSSISSITVKLGIIEKHDRDQSTQIGSLINKDSSIESNLKKTDLKLSQVVKNRQTDKASLTSVIDKVNTAEQIHGNQNKQLQALQNKDNDHSIKIQALATKQDAFDIKQIKRYKELKTKVDALPTKVSSIGNRVIVLEKANKKMETDRTTDKASISSATKRLGAIEQHGRDYLTQIKSLVNKDSALESSLKQTDQRLSQEVKNRLVDKTSLTSVMKKVSTVEKANGDQNKKIQALKNKQSVIDYNLQETSNKLLQVISNRLSDRETITDNGKKISDLEIKRNDQSKGIKSLTDKYSALNQRLSSEDKINTKQSGDIKNIWNRINKVVTPGLNRVNSLQKSNTNLSNQIKGLVNKDKAISGRVSALEKKHPRCLKTFFGKCQKWSNG